MFCIEGFLGTERSRLDFLAEHELLAQWLMNYGSFALFGLLAVGIIALPIPDESLMVLSGVLMFNGSLDIAPTLLAAYAGSMTGITISFIIGKTFGKYVIRRFGGWLGVTDEKIRSVYEKFHHFGKWALFFGYFIPGIRHLTGVVAGSIGLEYGYFAIFAYSGAFVWSSVFLSLGYFFGSYWIEVTELAEIYADELVIAALILFVVYLRLRSRPS